MRITFDLSDNEHAGRRFRPGCFDEQIGGRLNFMGSEAELVGYKVVNDGQQVRFTVEVDGWVLLGLAERESVDAMAWAAGDEPMWFSRATLAGVTGVTGRDVPLGSVGAPTEGEPT